VNLQPLWRIAIAINDTEKDLGAMPPLGEGEEDTVGDKVLLLKCNQVGLPFVGDKDQFAKVGKLIAADIEAFAYFIDNYRIPESIKVDKTDLRFGFNRFHNPDLLAVLNQNSNDRTLLSVTDMVFFDSDFYAEGFRLDIHQGTQRRYWRGKASQWSKFLLLSRDIPHKVKSTVEGELGFGDSAVKAGLKLKSIAEISKGRVVRDKGGERLWTIWEREDIEAG
jgi:hypothetical protein